MNRRQLELAAGGFLLGVMLGLLLVPGAMQRLVPSRRPAVAGKVLIGGPFDLVDHDGRHVTDAAFRGRPLLIYFGSCNGDDLDRAALQVMTAALAGAGTRAGDVAVVMVALEPPQMSPADLARCVAGSDPRIVALSGTKDELRAVAQAWRVPYHRATDEDTDAGHAMTPSPIMYLMSRDGGYLAYFTPASPASQIAAALRDAL